MSSKYNKIKFHMRYGILEIIQLMFYRKHLIKEDVSYLRREKYYRNLDKCVYEKELKDWLNLLDFDDDIENPQTFNGKIQWLKIHDNIPIKTVLSDKYAVRKWIRRKIGDEYLISLVGSWEKVEDINFESLPNCFVFKSNTGSGRNYIVKDKNKCNWNEIKKILSKWQKYSFGWDGLELQYVNIPRKILAEEYIEQTDGNLYDYKIHCFNGEPQLIQVIGDRNLEMHTGKEAFYNIDWERNDMMYHTYDQYEKEIPEPGNLDKMLNVARILSKDFKYVRVDLYDINGDIKFGEMTFTPANGLGNWEGSHFGSIVGSWI